MFSIFIVLGIVLPELAAVNPVQAQASSRLNGIDSYSAQVGFVPPASDGAPRRTRSGATRVPEQCGGLPLLPATGSGLTASEQLSLYVYFAKGSTVSQAMLSMKTADESEYYETSVSLPQEQFAENGAVVEIKLPETLPNLVAGEDYSWSLVLMCNGQLRPDSPVLEGGIKRVAAVVSEREGASLAEQAEMYGQAGLWYDWLSTLALMRTKEPNSAQLIDTWSGILSTVGLEDVAETPLIVH
ncbi:MAG: DUF928 domain-containing protein [Phormidesmis sp. RL_2_1]|nr:DUF928 domain-containing protein [Phormidesmis sp. RL_2_1]